MARTLLEMSPRLLRNTMAAAAGSAQGLLQLQAHDLRHGKIEEEAAAEWRVGLQNVLADLKARVW